MHALRNQNWTNLTKVRLYELARTGETFLSQVCQEQRSMTRNDQLLFRYEFEWDKHYTVQFAEELAWNMHETAELTWSSGRLRLVASDPRLILCAWPRAWFFIRSVQVCGLYVFSSPDIPARSANSYCWHWTSLFLGYVARILKCLTSMQVSHLEKSQACPWAWESGLEVCSIVSTVISRHAAGIFWSWIPLSYTHSTGSIR